MLCHGFKGGIGTSSRLVETKSGRRRGGGASHHPMTHYTRLWRRWPGWRWRTKPVP